VAGLAPLTDVALFERSWIGGGYPWLIGLWWRKAEVDRFTAIAQKKTILLYAQRDYTWSARDGKKRYQLSETFELSFIRLSVASILPVICIGNDTFLGNKF